MKYSLENSIHTKPLLSISTYFLSLGLLKHMKNPMLEHKKKRKERRKENS